MTARSLHRLLLHAPKQQRLVLEPWGMEIDVAAGEEIIVEVTAADPPDFDVESFTLWAGSGAELRVLCSGQEIYSTVGIPVPATPPGMSARSFPVPRHHQAAERLTRAVWLQPPLPRQVMRPGGHDLVAPAAAASSWRSW